MTPIQRFWIYQKTRFPLFKTVPLLLVFSAASVNVSALMAGRDLPDASHYVMAFILVFILFFQMRAADEWKDREIDQMYRPERPIPSGLVKLSSVLALAIGLMPFAVAAALAARLEVLGLLLLVWLWLMAMTLEFGVPAWLVKRPLIYLLSHMLIMPLIDLLLTGVEWTAYGAPAPALWLFLALSFVNGCVLELGRKTWSPDSERKGVETYSKLWGYRQSAIVWLVFVFCSGVLLTGVGWSLNLVWPMLVMALLGMLMSVIFAFQFVRSPTKNYEKRIDTMAGVWVLLCYATAGFLPLLM